MSDQELFPRERWQRVLYLLSSRGRVAVSELCRDLSISRATARRDLNALAHRRLLVRTHGGALARQGLVQDVTFEESSRQFREERQAIGALAAGLVREGESVILDAGATTLEVARALRLATGISVITNSVPIAAELLGAPKVTVYLVGGKVWPASAGTVGFGEEPSRIPFLADRGFFGINAIDLKDGLSAPDLEVATCKIALMARCREVAVVADHSKFGRRALVQVASLSAINRLITDWLTAPEVIRELQKLGIEVLTAQSPEEY